MQFVKVLNNDEDDNGDILRQAIFMLPPTVDEKEKYFLYSYSKKQDMNVDETMVFSCDEEGNSGMSDLISAPRYVHSSEVMDRLVEMYS